MNLEIERKFLLKGVPAINYKKQKLISQCYVWSEEKQNFNRYREVFCVGEKNKYFHTFKKFIKHGVQEEYEEEIDSKQFQDNYDNCDRYLRKRRYLFESGGLTWEIDEFLDMSLVVAEIELPTEDYELELPQEIKKELIMEVTKFPEFYNSNLAIKIKK